MIPNTIKKSDHRKVEHIQEIGYMHKVFLSRRILVGPSFSTPFRWAIFLLVTYCYNSILGERTRLPLYYSIRKRGFIDEKSS